MEITDKPLFVAVDLTQYDGEGGAAGAGADGISGGDTQAGAEVAAQHKNSNSPVTVKYGKQADGATDGALTDTIGKDGKETKPADTAKAFDELVNGEFKDEFNKRLQSAIDKRFGETKQVKTQLDASNKLLDKLHAKYGTADLKSLEQAIDADNAFYEEQAAAVGMDVDTFKQFQEMKVQNQRYAEQKAEYARQQEADRVLSGWLQEVDRMKASGDPAYANIDLKVETQNPIFNSIVKSGAGIQAAYDVVHRDERTALAMKAAAAEAQQKTVNTIRQQGARPSENGTGVQGGIEIKSDPSKLNKADRANILKQVFKGAKISF